MASSGRPKPPGRPSRSEGAGPARGDAELIDAIKRGDPAAFGELVGRHERSLINFFFHFSWDRQTAEDCAQEVFLKLFSHLGSYEPQAKFTTFLYRVARNHWIDKLRAGAGDARPISLEADARGEERSLKDRLPSSADTPLELLEKRELEESLCRAIDELPEEQRMVVVLAERQGLRYEEIGQILEIPVGTVKSRMHAAVEKLKERMNGRL